MPRPEFSAKGFAPPPPLDAAKHALFLDIDGTLLELQARPDTVVADEGLCDLLQRLAGATKGALAIVTGRAVDDADRLLGRTAPCVAGLHGQEWRLGDHTLQQPYDPHALDSARTIVRRLVDGGALEACIEDKGAGLALHYRHAPEHGGFVARAVNEIASRNGLQALHGGMVSEILPRGATKGGAVLALMREPPFASRIPVAIGDDVIDEDTFMAANELGGVSVLVGERRTSAATHGLADVAAVRDWLNAALER